MKSRRSHPPKAASIRHAPVACNSVIAAVQNRNKPERASGRTKKHGWRRNGAVAELKSARRERQPVTVSRAVPVPAREDEPMRKGRSCFCTLVGTHHLGSADTRAEDQTNCPSGADDHDIAMMCHNFPRNLSSKVLFSFKSSRHGVPREPIFMIFETGRKLCGVVLVVSVIIVAIPTRPSLACESRLTIPSIASIVLQIHGLSGEHRPKCISVNTSGLTKRSALSVASVPGDFRSCE